MVVRVIAFASSPRRHGNSETLLDWVLESLTEEGAEVEKVALSETNLHPCRGCNICETANRCVQRDFMDTAHDKIIEADCIIFASPIFCMGICSQGKALIDRAQVFRSRKYVLKLPIVPPERKEQRVGIFISSAGQHWDYVFDAAIPSIKCFFNVIDIKNKNIRYLMVNGIDEKGAVERHPTAREDAYRLGKDVVAQIRESKAE